jgi:hypothetical protein
MLELKLNMTNTHLQAIRTASHKATLFFIFLCVPLGLAHIWINFGEFGPDIPDVTRSAIIFKLFFSSFGLLGASGLTLIATTIASWVKRD